MDKWDIFIEIFDFMIQNLNLEIDYRIILFFIIFFN